MNDMVVLGAGPESAALAAQLKARDFVDQTVGTAVIVWGASESNAWQINHVDDFEAAVLAGLGRYLDVLRARELGGVNRIVNVVLNEGRGELASTLCAVVGGLTRSWARELARHGATVNAVGYGGPDAALRAAEAVDFLACANAAYITGQSLGSVGQRLADPRAKPSAPKAGPVLVSGGAGVIGAAITRGLHAAGRHVVVGYTREPVARELVAGLDAPGRPCSMVHLDIADPHSIDDAVRQLSDGMMPTDLVVCGGWNRTARFWDTNLEEGARTLAINLTGPMRLLRDLSPVIDSAGGAVVGISSESARNGDPGRSVYAGAKAGLSRLLSHMHATSQGLVGISVSPGPVDTPLMRVTHGDPETAERAIEKIRMVVPMRRLGTPEEIAHGVVGALGHRGTFLGGEVLSIGGGTVMT